MDPDQCYEILGVEPDASLDQVRQAWRDLVQVWHPDKFHGNPRLQRKAEEKLKEINQAYDCLCAVGPTPSTGPSQGERPSQASHEAYRSPPPPEPAPASSGTSQPPPSPQGDEGPRPCGGRVSRRRRRSAARMFSPQGAEDPRPRANVYDSWVGGLEFSPQGAEGPRPRGGRVPDWVLALGISVMLAVLGLVAATNDVTGPHKQEVELPPVSSRRTEPEPLDQRGQPGSRIPAAESHHGGSAAPSGGAPAGPTGTAADSTTSVAAINAYCREIDQYANDHPDRCQRFGAGESEVATSHAWRAFNSDQQRNEVLDYDSHPDKIYSRDLANVYVRSGAVVVSYCLLDSASGDWAHYITYYYRRDGTLAKLDSELRDLAYARVVIRTRYYGADGTLIASETRYFDIHTRRRKKPSAELRQDLALPGRAILIYERAGDLPFYELVVNR
ncbi:MAG: J domain-containing protein [Armatimonadetes bacterium]|nr:J domain-containing protein [Armatimonadota bacterium]